MTKKTHKQKHEKKWEWKQRETKIEDNECYGVAITLLGVDRGKKNVDI